MQKNPSSPNELVIGVQSATRFLTPQQVAMIEEALGSLGEYGELRLIIEKGRLRYIVTQKSFDAMKWTPGVLTGEQAETA